MGHSHGKTWTDALVEAELRRVCRDVGRMPSVNELRSLGKNDLALAACRRGGMRNWALKLGVPLKGTTSHVGLQWQDHERFYFESKGWAVVSCSTRAPFDLEVNGWRVDVKVATFRSYHIGKNGESSGYFFSGLKLGKTCDIFDLICLEKDTNDVLCRFIVPSLHAQVQTLTISPATLSGKSKYAAYRDNLDPLESKRL